MRLGGRHACAVLGACERLAAEKAQHDARAQWRRGAQAALAAQRHALIVGRDAERFHAGMHRHVSGQRVARLLRARGSKRRDAAVRGFIEGTVRHPRDTRLRNG